MAESLKKILVTGFPPFGLRSIPLPVPGWHGNLSQDICLWLEKQEDLKPKIHVRIVEVDFLGHLTGRGQAYFAEGLDTQPAGIFMLGEDRTFEGYRSTGVRSEPYAVIKGMQTGTRYSRCAASRAQRAQSKEGSEIHVSGSSGIGNMGCNQLYGQAIAHARKRTPVLPVQFLHCGFADTMESECRYVRNELLRMISIAL